MESSGPLPNLHFINTSHPKDATRSDALRQIRSHAAKETRCRGRNSAKHITLVGTKRKSKGHAKVGKDAAQCRQTDNRLAYLTSTFDKGQEHENPYPIVLSSLEYFDPCQAINLSRFTTCWGSARPFSNTEYFLFDHYINFFIPFSIGSCHKKKNPNLIAIQMNHWVPFALADIGLIAAMFLQACRSLESINQTKIYEALSTEYRLQCIRSTNASISAGTTQISDATIGKVMIMAADEFERGNLDGWNTHLLAITWMIDMRGGVDSLGVGGFMKEILINTPYCYGYTEE